MNEVPLYPIGVVADLLNVEAVTLRAWERRGLIRPFRRGTHRCYSDLDLRRLLFIRHLLQERGMNLAGIKALIQWYPCWEHDICVCDAPQVNGSSGDPPCWKRLEVRCRWVAQKRQCREESRNG
jgi:DNA-binding transcriptional MerR regulator